MIRTLRLSLAGLVLLLPLLAAEDDASWPLFHGNPQQTGLARGKLPDKLDVLWTFKTGDSLEGAVAVAGGVVFAGSMDEHLYAIGLKDGKEKWKYKAGPIKAAPAYRDGLIYAGDLDGNLHCVEAAKGSKRWSFESGSEVGGVNFHGESTIFSSHDEHLYCLDKAGKQRWKFKTDGPIYGAPAVAEGKTFLVGCDSQLHVIDVKAGKQLATVNLDGQAGATAAVKGDRLYVGTMSNQVLAIDWKKAEVVWKYEAERRRQPFYASAAVTDKLVIVGGRDRRVVAIDRATGKEAWAYGTDNRVDCSPVVVGERVYVGSLDDHFYVLNVADGKEVQKFKLDGPVSGSPAVAGGRVLVGTQTGMLYCYGE